MIPHFKIIALQDKNDTGKEFESFLRRLMDLGIDLTVAQEISGKLVHKVKPHFILLDNGPANKIQLSSLKKLKIKTPLLLFDTEQKVTGNRPDNKNNVIPVNFSFSDEELLTILLEITALHEKNIKTKLKSGHEADSDLAAKQIEFLSERFNCGIFTIDSRYRITGWNRQAEIITGYKKSEVIGKLCFVYARGMCTMECFSRYGHQPDNWKEFILRQKNGREIYISKWFMPLKNDKGEITGGIEYFVDTSADKSLNSELAENKKILGLFYSQLVAGFVLFTCEKPYKKTLPANTHDWLKVLADEFLINDCNDTLLVQKKFIRKEIIGQAFKEYIGDQYLDLTEDWMTLLNNGKHLIDLKLTRKEGSFVWLEASFQCLFNDTGDITGILVVQRDITRRHKAIVALEESEERFRKLSQLSFEGIVIFHENRILDANEAFLSLIGYTKDEKSGDRVILDFFPVKYHKQLSDSLKSGSSIPLEFEIYKRDGSLIPVEIEIQTVKYNKDLVHVMGIRDITNRKKTEDEIIKLSVAVEQSANVVLITKKTGEIEYVNKAFTKITGYTPDEVIGNNPRILKSGVQPPSFYQELWQTLEAGRQWKGEFQNRKKNGDLFWESATITPVKNRDGNIVRYIAIKEDITSQKIAEETLKESELKFRSLVSNIPGVIYRAAYDSDRTLLYVTNSIESLCGYKAEDFLNSKVRSFKSIIHPDDLERVMDTIKTGTDGFQQYSLEYRIITGNNTVKWVSESGRPLFDDKHNVKWLDGFIHDITERVKVLEELKKAKISAEEANKAKTEFLANISHEIRTPLNSVLGFADLLEGLITEEVQIKYLQSIRASGKNLMTLINDLLDLSKIEAGKVTLNYSNLKIRELLSEINDIFSLRIANKGIEFQIDIQDNFPQEIVTDEVRLRQILINLIGNAIKFTHSGGVKVVVEHFPLKVKSHLHILTMKIQVIDTGIGIPEDSFHTIFESFRQQSQLNTRKYGGTGLGLSITKRLVEAMNGTIKVESKVSEGSTFTLIFSHVEYVGKLPLVEKIRRSMKQHHEADVPEVSGYDRVPDENRGAIKAGANEIKNPQISSVLLQRFENEIYKKWKTFETKQPLKEIQQFALEIIKEGRDSNIGIIWEFGEKLLVTIDNFDIEEMRLQLEKFPKLLSKLKKA